MKTSVRWSIMGIGVAVALTSGARAHAGHQAKLPVMDAQLTYAPEVPPPITRKSPAIVKVTLDGGMTQLPLDGQKTYMFWTFNGHTPGPFPRSTSSARSSTGSTARAI